MNWRYNRQLLECFLCSVAANKFTIDFVAHTCRFQLLILSARMNSWTVMLYNLSIMLRCVMFPLVLFSLLITKPLIQSKCHRLQNVRDLLIRICFSIHFFGLNLSCPRILIWGSIEKQIHKEDGLELLEHMLFR